MSDEIFFPGPPILPDDPEEIVTLDPLLERRLETQAWRIRSAQWRAVALAEAAFGQRVTGRLAGRGGFDRFKGLLTLSVPFRGLEDHRYRESLFLAWTSQDPVLSRVPFVFIFFPEPVFSP